MTDDRSTDTPRVAIVTGAASGIGLATARRLVDHGWRVVAADRDDAGLAVLDAELPNDVLVAQHTDITRTEDVQRVIETALTSFGRLDALINSAGVTTIDDGPIDQVSEELFDRIVGINLRGTFLMCKYAIGALRSSGGGAIVNLGSVASIRGVGGVSYVASKAGILGLTRALATHHAADRIRCNLVAPGRTATPMLEIVKKKTNAQVADTYGSIPGEAQADEVAALIEFLASDTSRFITGATYTIDGGMTQH